MKILILVFCLLGHCGALEILKDYPIHEAFVADETDQIVFERAPQKPPREINELKPSKVLQKGEWIKGYWHFAKEKNEFVWITGVWRKAPPLHQWVDGKWVKEEQGWIWLKGFWSRRSQEELIAQKAAPPEPMIEKKPLSPGNNYFWAQGHFRFDAVKNSYFWIHGQWETFKENWIYVPAHYLWRREGYVYVEPYWDYPLDQRGEAYPAVHFLPAEQRHLQYRPQKALKEDEILQCCYLKWPNFLSLHHYYYHFKSIYANSQKPPWWHWQQWWALNPYEQWWNWRWWTHFKYPNPPWITPGTAAVMYAANTALIERMKEIEPPYYVTSRGVVSAAAVNDVLQKRIDFKAPVVEPSQLQGVQSAVWGQRSDTMTNMRPGKKIEEEVKDPPLPYFPSPVDQKASQTK